MPRPEKLRRVLVGDASSVPHVRAAIRGFLGDTPRTDDAELIGSELSTNAVRHSASREGGKIELHLESRPGWLRIEVVDQGPPTRAAPAGEPDEAVGPIYHRESGRGLLIVDALADAWGHEQHPEHALFWAELWTDKERSDA